MAGPGITKPLERLPRRQEIALKISSMETSRDTVVRSNAKHVHHRSTGIRSQEWLPGGCGGINGACTWFPVNRGRGCGLCAPINRGHAHGFP